MAQKIKIECEINEHDFTTQELSAIQKVACRFAEQDLRVTADPTNIKIYVGAYYDELYRLWVTSDGTVSLVEKDVSMNRDHGDWQRSEMLYMTLDLIIDQPRGNVIDFHQRYSQV